MGIADQRVNFLADPKDRRIFCEQRASADLDSAAQADTEHGRQVLERSAASWLQRAKLLERLETRFASRQDADK